MRASALAALAISASGCERNVERAEASASARVEEPQVVDSCRSSLRPSDAVVELQAGLELAAWQDATCNALVVELVNHTSEAVAVWDEKLRWSVEDGRLRVEPVPEQDVGKPRSLEMNRATCFGMFATEGRWTAVPSTRSFRWVESLMAIETDDMRAICTGHSPVFYDATLSFDSIDVVVAALSETEARRYEGRVSSSALHRKGMRVVAELALVGAVEARAFRPEFSVTWPDGSDVPRARQGDRR